MRTTKKIKETYSNVEDFEANCYLFFPSISKRRIVCGKSYYVRRYFRGGTDFERTMERLATIQVNKNVR